MKKLFKSKYSPVIICFFSIIILGLLFCYLFSNYYSSKLNLTTQQGWESDKEGFDKAFEIVATDKESPTKSLYIVNFKDLLGKQLDAVIAGFGRGASVVGNKTVGLPTDKIEKEVTLNLSNESSNVMRGTPTVLLGVNHDAAVVKISMSCNTSLLGYGALSFSDLINNEHVVEKTLSEAGLYLENGSIISPRDRSLYTKYAADGVTVETENFSFSGECLCDYNKYYWSANLMFDYTVANQKGDLAYTVRTISFSIEL